MAYESDLVELRNISDRLNHWWQVRDPHVRPIEVPLEPLIDLAVPMGVVLRELGSTTVTHPYIIAKFHQLERPIGLLQPVEGAAIFAVHEQHGLSFHQLFDTNLVTLWHNAEKG